MYLTVFAAFDKDPFRRVSSHTQECKTKSHYSDAAKTNFYNQLFQCRIKMAIGLVKYLYLVQYSSMISTKGLHENAFYWDMYIRNIFQKPPFPGSCLNIADICLPSAWFLMLNMAKRSITMITN